MLLRHISLFNHVEETRRDTIQLTSVLIVDSSKLCVQEDLSINHA